MLKLSDKRLLLTVPLCVLLGLAGWLWIRYAGSPDLIWTAIDVNSKYQQADAHLLQINGQVNILIDTGHVLYANDLLRFLKDRNISRLKAVIISHGHRDHYGGLVSLLRNNIRVDAVYFNPPDIELVKHETWGCDMAEIEEIQRECSSRHIPVIAMSDRTQWLFDNDISLRVLYVFDGLDTPVGRTDINDTSAIMMLTDRNMKYLFTGDLNRPIGNYVTERRDTIPLKADVLKVPHHGAEGLAGDDFFRAVNPGAMIVPAPKALWLSDACGRMRMLAEDCPTFVNGLHGHITVKSYGHSYRIETKFAP